MSIQFGVNLVMMFVLAFEVLVLTERANTPDMRFLLMCKTVLLVAFIYLVFSAGVL